MITTHSFNQDAFVFTQALKLDAQDPTVYQRNHTTNLTARLIGMSLLLQRNVSLCPSRHLSWR